MAKARRQLEQAGQLAARPLDAELEAGRQLTVGVMVDPVYSHGRNIIRGITAFGMGAGWQFQRPTDWFYDRTSEILNWSVDGLIVAIVDDQMWDFVQKLGVPTVNTGSFVHYEDWPSAICDSAAIGRLAAMHYIDRGVKNLAFIGLPGVRWSDDRALSFAETAARFGIAFHHFPSKFFIRIPSGRARANMAGIGEWMSTLPPLTGIFAANDTVAETVLSVARLIGRHVPGDLAVLGSDNDDMTGQMSTPALSTIDTNAERVGHEAAKMLAGLMAGRPAPARTVRVAPVGVIARASSDVLAIGDPDVLAAVRFIRDRSIAPVNVDDVLAAVPLSRRSLENRFRSILGRSILDEIHRVHVERAAQLLVATDLPMPAVAKASGFASYTRLGIVFRKLTGRSPTSHRLQFRPARG